MGVEPFLVASALRGVVAQRLVRRICPHCKETYAPDAAERAYMGIALDEEVKLYKGAGCGKCNFTGYAGRMAIHEVLPIIPEMKELILKNAPDTEIFAAGRFLWRYFYERRRYPQSIGWRDNRFRIAARSVCVRR